MYPGIYIPIVTPFLNGEIDFLSLEKLINRFIDNGVSGLFAAATTGEAPTLSDEEYFQLIGKVCEMVAGRVGVYAGLSEHNTRLLVKLAGQLEPFPIEGILSSCPYYNLPAQQGIYEHFRCLSEATPHPVILYNIPCRTGRNIENDTIRRLAQLKNIIGLKDSCGNIDQSMELLLNRPDDFMIFTGHDSDFFLNLALGGDGGILASAHICTEQYVQMFDEFQRNNIGEARRIWKELLPVIQLLFVEPNPAPVKYVLAACGMIAGSEVRLPLTGISIQLKQKLSELNLFQEARG
ncbi:MAG: 4-hydroxy-tetrahydrodipicolinate synthase [Spirochaetales bacterium]|nr:4-hydroxy-tetrahydrodipicolinate synthase [Spirochaetales bacterium]